MSTLTPTPTIDNEIDGTVDSCLNLDGDCRELGMMDLLLVVAERAKTIAKVTICAMMLAIAGAFLLPNYYTATTRVLPPQQSQSMAAMLASQLGSLGPLGATAGNNLGLKSPNDIYIGMLKSETVENAQIKRFDLMKVYRDRRISDARRDLEAASKFMSTKEGFIAISVEDKNPNRAAVMANTYVDELRKLTERLAVTEAGQRRLFFEKQLAQTKSDLNLAEQAFKNVQLRTGVIQLDGQAKAIIESVVQLRAEIAAKEVQLHAMRSFATETNPDLALATQELSGLGAQLQKLEHQQGSGGGDMQVPAGQIPEAALEYAQRLRDVKYNEGLFELLSKQYEAAKMDEARQGTVIQVIDPAVEPDNKSSPHRVGLVLVITVLAMFLSIVWCILVGAIARQPRRQQQLRTLRQVVLNGAMSTPFK